MAMQRGTVIGIIAAFVVGCICGIAIGGYKGYRAGSASILNDALVKDAREVETRIAILKQLRSGEREPAIDRLETGLADILIAFDPDVPYAGLEAQTAAALGKAIDEAKAYRSEHPRRKEDFRDKMVENLIARQRYK